MYDLWSKAQEAAEEAPILYRTGRFNGAASRAYYAMFTAARCLLAKQGIAAAGAKRHATVWRQFSLHFVASGVFGRSDGEVIARMSSLRNVADYSQRRVSSEAADSTIAAMDRFMSIAEHQIDKAGPWTAP